jgi:hypothetical protein
MMIDRSGLPMATLLVRFLGTEALPGAWLDAQAIRRGMSEVVGELNKAAPTAHGFNWEQHR